MSERCKVGAWKKEKKKISRESTVFFDGYLGISDENAVKFVPEEWMLDSAPKNSQTVEVLLALRAALETQQS